MALPFLPFLLGAATGAAVTYIVTNKSAKTKLSGKTDNEAEKTTPAMEEEKT
ncbi:MAG: hypothetical protein ABFS56_17340 [Pseudomonadota bacterium]